MNLFQKLCARLTGHRFRKLYDIHWEGQRYCRCRICGHHFWIDEQQNLLRRKRK